MDNPALEKEKHLEALHGLERLNFWSGSSRVVWPPIAELARSEQNRPLRALDIATGGGDVPIALWRRAKQSGVRLEIDGCDLSPRAVELANQQARGDQAAVKFFLCDALKSELPGGYDVIVCSLFLHHLDPAEVVMLLQKMARATGQLIIINDLVRTRVNLAFVYIATRLLSRSPVVHFDGPVSVRAAYTIAEMTELAMQSGLDDCTISARFPCRFLLTWRKE